MKYISLFFYVLCLNSLFGQLHESSIQANSLIQKAVDDKKLIGISAGFSINGDIKWQASTGYSRIESESSTDETSQIRVVTHASFDTNTQSRIASITKVMTAIAVMQLFEQGKLVLDIPIQTYIPSFPRKKEGEITVRHLLQHASGIKGYKNMKEQENTRLYSDLLSAITIFKDRQLNSIPGQEFLYSSYGYVVLGHIIEQVSGMDYATYMQTQIWDKADMQNTGIEHSNAVLPNLSSLFHVDSKGKIKLVKRTNLSDRIPGGGVYSTVTDILKFGNAILNNSLISESTFNMMVEDSKIKKQENGYGLGMYLYGKNPKYGNVFGHNGAQTGASTFLMLLPEQRMCVVVLSNTSGAMQTVSDITLQLFDIASQTK